MALNGQMPFAKGHYFKTIVTAEAKLDLERKGVQSYQRDIYAVSYTHLTLPTILLV